jgi:hypothetical protein
MSFLLAVLLLIPSQTPLWPDEEPPVAGQPEHFSGAVGSYRVSTRATPTELEAGESLILTIRIAGSGPKSHLPARLDLRRYALFKKRFVIEDIPKSDRYAKAENAWEFHYRLKPRWDGVNEVPALAFAFYRPGIVPRSKGFQTSYAPPIPLTIKPRYHLNAEQNKLNGVRRDAPDSVYRLATSDEVLGRKSGMPFAGAFSIVLILLAPPVACVLWCALWRKRYPDAARLARRRQSRAARQALSALRGAERDGLASQATAVSTILAVYFRQRFDLAAREIVPAEVAACLIRAGLPPDAIAHTTALLRSCDAARFAPSPISGNGDIIGRAEKLVVFLEAEACSSLDL